MSTYRERRERRAEQLRQRAQTADVKANAAHAQSRAIGDLIPFGQPILVGHHSQRRHERDIARIDRAMRASVEGSQKADGMRSRADNIEAAADRAIYDDDPDAIERLTARIAQIERRRDEMKDRNARYRSEHKAELRDLHPYERNQRMPHPAYEVTNLTANIGRLRKRLEHLQAPERGRWLLSRFPGECRSCERAVDRGERVFYFKRTREVECESCATPPEAA